MSQGLSCVGEFPDQAHFCASRNIHLNMAASSRWKARVTDSQMEISGISSPVSSRSVQELVSTRIVQGLVLELVMHFNTGRENEVHPERVARRGVAVLK